MDDDDLLLEQEEWKGRIYRNILKSMTASAEQNELLLKRIEEQVGCIYITLHNLTLRYVTLLYITLSYVNLH